MSLFLIFLFNTIIFINTYQKIENLLPYNLNVTSEIILENTNSKFESQSYVFILLKPYLKEFMFGTICIFINNNFDDDSNCLDINIDKQDAFKFNILKETNNLFIKIKGKFHGLLSSLNTNQINILDINYSYFFDNIQLDTEKYLSFKIPKLKENKILNIILFENNCNSLKIYKNNEIISCNNNVDNYISLESGSEYIMEYYPNLGYSLAINFLENIIIDLNSNEKSIQTLNYFDFYFIINLANYQVNEEIGLLVESNYRFSIKGGFLMEDINRNELFDESIFSGEIIKEEELRYFIICKNQTEFNYFLFGIKIYSYKGESFNIKLINSIVKINDTMFQYKLNEKNRYLFKIDENLIEKYIDYESDICLSYEKDNKMITLVNDDIYYKNKLLFLDIKLIEGIFFDEGEKGIFTFKMMEQSFSLSINKNYFSEFYTNSKYISSFIPNFNDYFVYYGLIAGNTKFSLFDGVENEKINYNQFSIFSHLINETKLIAFDKKTSSLIESFYEIQQSFNYTIKNSKIILLRNNLDYFLNINNEKIKIKLLTDSKVKIIDNDKIYELTSKNNYIKISFYNNIIKCSGDNSLINIFFPLTNKSEENIQICNGQENCEFKNTEEFFIIFPLKNFNMINLNIFIEDDSLTEIKATYLIDYNEIPYSRNKYNLKKEIILTNKNEHSLLVKNIIQNDIVKHSIEEKYYIYFLLNQITKKINVRIEYFNSILLDNFDLFLLNKGKNKIYLGNNNITYIQVDQCKNKNNSINYSIIRDEKINPSEKNIIFNSEEKIIKCEKNDEDNYLSLEIESKEELLLSKSNSEIEFLEDFIFDFEIYIDQYEKDLIIDFYSVSLFPQVEYYIIILKGNYLNDLNNHCFIQHILETKDYILKEIIFSNGEENSFSKIINTQNILESKNIYSIVVLAKEIHENYFLYRYYNPKEFTISTKEEEDGENKNILIWILIPIGIIIFIIIGFFIYRFISKKRLNNLNINLNDLELKLE